jgi:hypothetical protein
MGSVALLIAVPVLLLLLQSPLVLLVEFLVERMLPTKFYYWLVASITAAVVAIGWAIYQIPVDAQRVVALSEQLATVDCSTIKRLEPDEVPDGGIERYMIAYACGKASPLVCDPGAAYVNGESPVKPIKVFIQSLNLPADAASRHQPSAP